MENHTVKVIDVKPNIDQTYFLIIEKSSIKFKPGQYVTISSSNLNEAREYSIYSSTNETNLVFLIKKLPGGIVSNYLYRVKKGDDLIISEPIGDFIIDNNQRKKIFIATGTGIAPFHSYIMSVNDKNYILLHGVRDARSFYSYNSYNADNIISCTSKSNDGKFNGRVTKYIDNHSYIINEDFDYYLCGNFSMISEVSKILSSKGVKNIKSEIFY
jgi:ferredoxin-NADP reductase